MKRVSLLSLAVCQGLVAALMAASCAPPAPEAGPPDVNEILTTGSAAPDVVHAAVWLCARSLTEAAACGWRLSVGHVAAVRVACEKVRSERISDGADAFFRKKAYLCTYLI